MTGLKIRKLISIVEETNLEIGQTISPPTRKAASIAIIKNPFAGVFYNNLELLVEIGEELGQLLGDHAVAALGVTSAKVEAYGKAALVGENGELEHAAAILHPKLGAPLRMAVDKGAALVPSSKKMGAPGAPLDIPLGHKDAAYVRSHFDGMEVHVNDAPRPNEIMIAIAVAYGGRPLARVGGLVANDAIGEDGLR